MITGFNTDIQYDGVTYHVQTEDKGLETPLILSLVYVGGAILASKRAPYHDLIAAGFDEKTLTERLQRQHKLICAAIRAGRIEDLKRLSGPESASRQHAAPTQPAAAPPPAPPPSAAPTRQAPAPRPARAATDAGPARVKTEVRKTEAPAPALTPRPAPERRAEPRPSLADEFRDALVYDLQTPVVPVAPPEVVPAARQEVVEPPAPSPVETARVEGAAWEGAEDELYLRLLDDEGDFRAGQLATIKIHVGRGAYGQRAVANADVSIKILGTTFRPLILSTQTDDEGVAVVRALLPRFTSGRAAIIIRAHYGEDEAELRRIIHQ